MNARNPARLLDRSLLRKAATMLIALLLCLSVASPPVYADTTVNIANTSMQECLRRVCRDIINSVPAPDAELENLLGKDYYLNECVKGGVSRVVCEAEQVYGVDNSGNLKVPQDVAESLQKLDTLNERLNDSGSSQKTVIPTQKPRYGIDNAIERAGLFVSQVQKDAKNADGFFSASVAYAEGVLGIVPVILFGLGEDAVRQHTPELEALDTALSFTGVHGIAKGIVKKGPSFIKDNFASILQRNPNNAMRGATDAAKRLGVKLDKIPISNGVARTKIDVSSTLDPKDINQLKDVLRSRGATRAEVDTGFVANEKLDAFLRRRVQDGKPFNGGTVRFSNSKNSDFTIDFDL